MTYKGTHEALVAAEVWYQVQTVLSMHRSAADATQIHDHYLKGTVFCVQSGSAAGLQREERARQCLPVLRVRSTALRGSCTRQAMLIEEAERLVERHYESVQISAQTPQAVAEHLHGQFDELMASEADALSDLTKDRSRLEGEQGGLLQATTPKRSRWSC